MIDGKIYLFDSSLNLIKKPINYFNYKHLTMHLIMPIFNQNYYIEKEPYIILYLTMSNTSSFLV